MLPHSVLTAIRRTVVVPVLAVDGVAGEHRTEFCEIALAQRFDGYFGRVQLVAGFDVRERLAEITAPTLVLAGAGDKLVPVGCSIELASRLPNATLRVLEHAGHACLLAADVSLVSLLEDWAPAQTESGHPSRMRFP